MPTSLAIFLGVAAAVILYCVLMIAAAFARSGIASDCKRDGFTWINGQKIECAVLK